MAPRSQERLIGSQLIDELVALAGDDALEHQQELANKRPPEQQAQADAAVREAHDRIESLEEQVSSLTAALSSAEASNAELETVLASLKRVALAVKNEPANGSEPKPKSTKRKMRRTARRY